MNIPALSPNSSSPHTHSYPWPPFGAHRCHSQLWEEGSWSQVWGLWAGNPEVPDAEAVVWALRWHIPTALRLGLRAVIELQVRGLGVLSLSPPVCLLSISFSPSSSPVPLITFYFSEYLLLFPSQSPTPSGVRTLGSLSRCGYWCQKAERRRWEPSAHFSLPLSLLP